MSILIFGAMDAEISEFLSCMQDRETQTWNGFLHHRGRIAGKSVLVSKTGVGKVMAAMVTQHLIDKYQPKMVLFTGLAGSLQPHIEIGDTVIARDLVQHDMEPSGIGFPRGQIPYSDWRFLSVDASLLALAQAYQPKTGRVHLGRVCTGDQFITHAEMESHAYLIDELAGDVVEMEGASVAQVCLINAVPFLVVRTVSDKADGSATINFEEFLPGASLNSLDFVNYLLARIED